MKSIYIVGSLRNPEVHAVAKQVREELGIEAFDNWSAAGPHADDCWQQYSKEKGQSYAEALKDYSAKHVFEFDKKHLDRCDAALMVGPAGKSGHLELGYTVGRGKPAFILLDDPDRWDVMVQFATGWFFSVDAFTSFIHGCRGNGVNMENEPQLRKMFLEPQ